MLFARSNRNKTANPPAALLQLVHLVGAPVAALQVPTIAAAGLEKMFFSSFGFNFFSLNLFQ